MAAKWVFGDPSITPLRLKRMKLAEFVLSLDLGSLHHMGYIDTQENPIAFSLRVYVQVDRLVDEAWVDNF